MEIMRAVKQLLDPGNLLNPGVLLNDDPEGHLHHLKNLPAVSPLVDRCIECGFCEPVCPSRDLTFSPRQRIMALRAAVGGDPSERAAIKGVWRHRGLDTCAGDGMCATACPVDIDTGDLVRAERARLAPPWKHALGAFCMDHLSLVSSFVRGGLGLAHALGIHRLPGRSIPLPPPAKGLPSSFPEAAPGEPVLVYLPSCLARTLGKDQLPHLLHRLSREAGIGLRVPPGIRSLCCGQPFGSKGLPGQARVAARSTARALLQAVGDGPIQVIMDTSTCTGHLREAFHDLDGPLGRAARRIELIDPATAVTGILLPRLERRNRLNPGVSRLAVHPTCSDQRHGWTRDLLGATAASCAEADLPRALGCCAMAGDKGWQIPALSAAATRREASAVHDLIATAGSTTSTTCGLAMEAATGIDYHHLWWHLVQALRAS